jgi:hypothetical protein
LYNLYDDNISSFHVNKDDSASDIEDFEAITEYTSIYGLIKSKDEKKFLETGWMDEDIYIVFQQYFAAKVHLI